MNQVYLPFIIIFSFLTILVSELKSRKLADALKFSANKLLVKLVFVSGLFLTVEILLFQFNTSDFFKNTSYYVVQILEGVLLTLIYLVAERVYKFLRDSGAIAKALGDKKNPQRQVLDKELQYFGLNEMFFVAVIYLSTFFVLFVGLILAMGLFKLLR